MKGMDRDLLLVHQGRRLSLSLKDLNAEINKLKKDRKVFFRDHTYVYLQTKEKWKRHYIKKYNHLWDKQKKEIKKELGKNKIDYNRYKRRRKEKSLKRKEEEILRASSIVLNKSNVVLNDNHRLLLSKGFNFVPTPKWNEAIESSEWLSLSQHTRSCEWSSVIGDNERNEVKEIPKKLKIPKTNRPDIDLVDEKTKTYLEMARSKLRNVQPFVDEMYKRKNNLNHEMKKAYSELVGLVNTKKIVICRADKDGKVVILNFDDYNLLMNNELDKFNRLEDLNPNNINDHFTNIRCKLDDFMTKLHQNEIIDDDFLKRTVGIKYSKNKYYKIMGPVAKYFKNNQPAYAYPLFKTHKLKCSELEKCNVFDIPVRLLQSAGNITTTRATTFIENLLNPISKDFCNYKINEYCKDSKSYLETLDKWKKDYNGKEELFIVAADVQSMYPSVKREIVRDGLETALKLCSSFSPTVRKTLIELTMFCLQNVVVQNQEKFYNQPEGIITGDNNSVTLANIALHHVLLPISEILDKAIVFKRYIDDIISSRGDDCF